MDNDGDDTRMLWIFHDYWKGDVVVGEMIAMITMNMPFLEHQRIQMRTHVHRI